MSGEITRIDENTIWIDGVWVRYISNGNFNHSYIGETVTLVINNDGIAIDCINNRHHKNQNDTTAT
jgi:hypothetical protein